MNLLEAKAFLAKLQVLLKLQEEANNSKNLDVINFVTKFVKENNHADTVNK
jgi:hypothetical protein